MSSYRLKPVMNFPFCCTDGQPVVTDRHIAERISKLVSQQFNRASVGNGTSLYDDVAFAAQALG